MTLLIALESSAVLHVPSFFTVITTGLMKLSFVQVFVDMSFAE